MAYSGRYRVKNIKKYRGDPDKVVYRSLWEKYCFEYCDRSEEVLTWSSEEIVIPYYYEVDKKYHRYYVDLFIKYKNRSILVEIKPKKETQQPVRKNVKSPRYINEALTYVKNRNKWTYAESFAKDRGWGFEIWTEETLQSMGIMKKPLKKLKPLKPLKRAKKRHK